MNFDKYIYVFYCNLFSALIVILDPPRGGWGKCKLVRNIISSRSQLTQPEQPADVSTPLNQKKRPPLRRHP